MKEAHKEMKIIDIEISSSGIPIPQSSPKVKESAASNSVANKETIEDGKSSETIFSGRHMPDAYNSILRPRGVEMYGTTALAEPNLEYQEGFALLPLKFQEPPGTSQHDTRP